MVRALRSVVPTVVTPAFTYQCMAPAPPDKDIPNNAELRASDWAEFEHALAITAPYHEAMRPSREIGDVAAALLTEPDAQRSTSPLMSFAAVGPAASALLAAGAPAYPLGVLERAAREDAWVLLLGVDHTVDSTIHAAEWVEHRGQFTRWARVTGPAPGWTAVGFSGDSRRFGTIARYLAGWQRSETIGAARCHAVPARVVMHTARALIQRDPAALLPWPRTPGGRAEAAVRQRLANLRSTGRVG